MAKVDLKKVKETPKETSNQITSRNEDGKTYFKGPFLDAEFESYSVCLAANQTANREKIHKEAGLNEHGQTSDQVKNYGVRTDLIAEKKALLSRIEEIDAKINAIGKEKLEEEKEPENAGA